MAAEFSVFPTTSSPNQTKMEVIGNAAGAAQGPVVFQPNWLAALAPNGFGWNYQPLVYSAPPHALNGNAGGYVLSHLPSAAGPMFIHPNLALPAVNSFAKPLEMTKRSIITSKEESRKKVKSVPSASDTDSDSEGAREGSEADGPDSLRVKGPWLPQEDKKLKELVAEFGPRWSVIAERLPGRIGKQCRERWLNHLDDKIKRSPWTAAEDAILLEAHKTKGNRWCQIAKLLPGRPENSVKNRYTSLAHKQAKLETARKHFSNGNDDEQSKPSTGASSSDQQ